MGISDVVESSRLWLVGDAGRLSVSNWRSLLVDVIEPSLGSTDRNRVWPVIASKTLCTGYVLTLFL